MKKHTVELLCLGRFLCQNPGFVFHNVLVYTRDQFPDVLQTSGKVVVIEIRPMRRYDPAGMVTHFAVTFSFTWRWNTARPIFRDHRDSTAQEVSEVVRQVAIRPLNNGVDCEIAILA